jgi:hypothetical protein
MVFLLLLVFKHLEYPPNHKTGSNSHHYKVVAIAQKWEQLE